MNRTPTASRPHRAKARGGVPVAVGYPVGAPPALGAWVFRVFLRKGGVRFQDHRERAARQVRAALSPWLQPWV